jgi:hypothetical protein
MFAAPMVRRRGRVLVDETGLSQPEPGQEPYAFHYFVDAGEAGAGAFEAFKRIEARGQLTYPGFIKRLFLAFDGQPGQFVYFSLWSSHAAAQEFHHKFVESEDYKKFYGALLPFVTPPTFADCRLVSDDVVAAAAA